MQDSVLQQQITELVEPLLKSLGLELWGLEFLPAGRSILRVYIEKSTPSAPESSPESSPENSPEDAPEYLPEYSPEYSYDDAPARADSAFDAGIEECSEASRLIGLTLEVEDPIPGPYVLEVSTPGMERRFFKPDQLLRYLEHPLELHFNAAPAGYPGRKKFTGILTAAKDGEDERVFTLNVMDAPDLTNTPGDGAALDFTWNQLKKARLLFMEQKQAGPAKKGQKKSAKAKK